MIFAHGMYNVLYKYRSHDRVNIYLLTYKSKENYNSVQLHPRQKKYEIRVL